MVMSSTGEYSNANSGEYLSVNDNGEGKLTLVPVRIRDAEPEGRLVLRSPAGWSVALPTSANADWVAGVLKHLP